MWNSRRQKSLQRVKVCNRKFAVSENSVERSFIDWSENLLEWEVLSEESLQRAEVFVSESLRRMKFVSLKFYSLRKVCGVEVCDGESFDERRCSVSEKFVASKSFFRESLWAEKFTADENILEQEVLPRNLPVKICDECGNLSNRVFIIWGKLSTSEKYIWGEKFATGEDLPQLRSFCRRKVLFCEVCRPKVYSSVKSFVGQVKVWDGWKFRLKCYCPRKSLWRVKVFLEWEVLSAWKFERIKWAMNLFRLQFFPTYKLCSLQFSFDCNKLLAESFIRIYFRWRLKLDPVAFCPEQKFVEI